MPTPTPDPEPTPTPTDEETGEEGDSVDSEEEESDEETDNHDGTDSETEADDDSGSDDEEDDSEDDSPDDSTEDDSDDASGQDGEPDEDEDDDESDDEEEDDDSEDDSPDDSTEDDSDDASGQDDEPDEDEDEDDESDDEEEDDEIEDDSGGGDGSLGDALQLAALDAETNAGRGLVGDIVESCVKSEVAGFTLLPPLMKVGYNYPWIANLYGNHIGPNRWKEPPDSQKDPYWKEAKDSLARNLATLSGMKVVVVRMFILCQGDNYRNNLTSYPSKVDAGKWDLPAALHPLFREHFQKMLEDFQKAEMQIIPSLIDFHFPDWENRDVIFTDTTKRDKFLDTVLDPLLNVSAGFKSTIFAWEVINEPSWLTRSISPPLNRKLTSVLSQSSMKSFLNKALAKIKDAGFE